MLEETAAHTWVLLPMVPRLLPRDELEESWELVRLPLGSSVACLEAFQVQTLQSLLETHAPSLPRALVSLCQPMPRVSWLLQLHLQALLVVHLLEESELLLG